MSMSYFETVLLMGGVFAQLVQFLFLCDKHWAFRKNDLLTFFSFLFEGECIVHFVILPGVVVVVVVDAITCYCLGVIGSFDIPDNGCYPWFLVVILEVALCMYKRRI